MGMMKKVKTVLYVLVILSFVGFVGWKTTENIRFARETEKFFTTASNTEILKRVMGISKVPGMKIVHMEITKELLRVDEKTMADGRRLVATVTIPTAYMKDFLPYYYNNEIYIENGEESLQKLGDKRAYDYQLTNENVKFFLWARYDVKDPNTNAGMRSDRYWIVKAPENDRSEIILEASYIDWQQDF